MRGVRVSCVCVWCVVWCAVYGLPFTLSDYLRHSKKPCVLQYNARHFLPGLPWDRKGCGARPHRAPATPRGGGQAAVARQAGRAHVGHENRGAGQAGVAESQPWSVADWAVALRSDNPRATVLVLVLG